jgi:SAM-dependent methyltransferase
MDPTEKMAAFFDARAEGYEDYFRDEILPGELFAQFYNALSAPIGETDEPLRILDLGCGTGLELDPLFRRVPNARVTGVDLAEGMLELLRAKYSARMGQITLVVDSFLTTSLGSQVYDHFCPPEGRWNDVNGMLYWKGRYHAGYLQKIRGESSGGGSRTREIGRRPGGPAS